MKFMQRDRERQKQEYNEMKAEYRRDVEAEKAERDKQAKALHNDWELPEEEEKEEEGLCALLDCISPPQEPNCILVVLLSAKRNLQAFLQKQFLTFLMV